MQRSRRHAPPLLLLLGFTAASCGGPSSAGDPSSDPHGDATVDDAGDASGETGSETGDETGDAAIVAWHIELDPSKPAGPIPTALLGQYDLSGALFHYPEVPGLIDAMKFAGFSEWRIGVGRWEIATRLLPTLTDGSSCATELAALPSEAAAPAGENDDTLIAARDWFRDDGKPVTEAMTLDDDRYALDYVRSVVDVALAFGTRPYVDIDLMPRALSKNQTPSRSKALIADACSATFTNAVSDVKPEDPNVFAAAVVGLVQRVVLGSGSEKGRAVQYWELWNEPEMPYFWDKSYESKGLDDWSTMTATALVRLDAMRTSATSPAMKALRFGMGSFAYATTAETFLVAFDGMVLPGGATLPLDFLSFHSYHDDPLDIVADLERVIAARSASKHYRGIELALAEWGPSLDSKGWDPTTMDAPLLVSTVIAIGATAGLEHAHRALFYDFYRGLPFGVVDHDARPKPLYYAYGLLSSLIGKGALRLPIVGHEDGKLDDGMGAVLASQADDGVVRVLLVNRSTAPRQATFSLATVPSSVSVYDVASIAPHEGDHASTVRVPPRSMVLVTF